MINYTWNCKTVDVYPQEGDLENVVYNVHWTLQGEDSETAYIGSCIGTQLLNTNSISEFTPFEDLTNDQVVKWTKDMMGEEQVASMEANIAKQIYEKNNPTSITLTIKE